MSYQPWQDMEETYMDVTKWKKPIWKGYKCIILTIWHSEIGKNRETTKRSVAEKGGESYK